jgi:hypothetical protein
VELAEDIGDVTGWMGTSTYSTEWSNGKYYWDHDVGYPDEMDRAESPPKVEGGMVVDVLTIDGTGKTCWKLMSTSFQDTLVDLCIVRGV